MLPPLFFSFYHFFLSFGHRLLRACHDHHHLHHVREKHISTRAATPAKLITKSLGFFVREIFKVIVFHVRLHCLQHLLSPSNNRCRLLLLQKPPPLPPPSTTSATLGHEVKILGFWSFQPHVTKLNAILCASMKIPVCTFFCNLSNIR
jgi:hypothetical protein